MEELLSVAMISCLCQTFFLHLNVVTTADVETRDIYLNSYAHCGRESMFQVTLRQEYLIKPDISPHTGTNSFRTCEVTFHSPLPDGHICLIQKGNPAKILDNNVELKVFDGLGNSEDKIIGQLKPSPDTWSKRDICSTSRFITFYLSEINKDNSADIRKLQLSFRIVDIRSRERTLYLDGTYCDNEYDLLDSYINLINRPQFPGMITKTLTSECAMIFRKVEASSNSSICVAYVPLKPQVTCDSSWRFVVSSAYLNVDEENIIYSLRCSDLKVNEVHAWCADVKQESVTVAFWRSSSIMSNSSVEPPGEFKFIMTDYEGSSENLLEEVKATLAADSSSDVNILMICLITGSGTLILVVGVCVYWNREKLLFFKYKAVKKRDTSDEGEAHL